MALQFLIVPIAAFFFEICPRLLNRKFGVDIWTHLLYLKEYHRQKGIPKKIESGFLVPGEYDYPPAFIFILAKFPFKLVEKYEFIFSPFFDALHLIIIYFIVYFLTGNLLLSLLTQILYSLTPIVILENSSATPRSLGYTLFTLVFILLFFFQQNGNLFLLAFAVIFGALIFLSHRFTTQGFFFFSLFFSLIYKTPLFILVFLVSFVLSLAFFKGFYLKVLSGHIGNLIFWYKNINFRFYHQVKGNYKKHKTEDFVFKLYNEFLKFPPFVLAITNPWTIPPILIFFALPEINPIFKSMLLWVIFSYFLSVITLWVPKLRFLGEGQRYLELSAFPAAFLSARFLVYSSGNLKTILSLTYLIVGLMAFLTIAIIQRKAIIKDKLRTLTPELEGMFNYLKNLKNKPRLLCIPHQITTSTIYHTGCSVFVNASYSNINLISDVYPYLKKTVEDIMQEHNLNAILLNEDYAKPEDLKIKKYEVVKKIANFILIKI